MAKGKHSAALFEVIKHQSGRPERADPTAKPSKWWFKSRPARESQSTPEALHADADRLEAPAAPPPRAAPRSSSRTGSNRSSAIHLDFDRDRKEVTLRLRYTTAIVSAFGICALIGIAYVIGGHVTHAPQVASAAAQPTVQQLL